MKYSECSKKVKNIISDILDECVEDKMVIFEEDMDRVILQVKLMSDITSFIFNNFGLEADEIM